MVCKAPSSQELQRQPALRFLPRGQRRRKSALADQLPPDRPVEAAIAQRSRLAGAMRSARCPAASALQHAVLVPTKRRARRAPRLVPWRRPLLIWKRSVAFGIAPRFPRASRTITNGGELAVGGRALSREPDQLPAEQLDALHVARPSTPEEGLPSVEGQRRQGEMARARTCSRLAT